MLTRAPSGLGSFFKSKSFRGKDTNSSGIYLDSVTEIMRGVQTDIMRKAGLVDPECCVSLCTAERSLDLTFPSVQERNMFIRAVNALVYPNEIFVS